MCRGRREGYCRPAATPPLSSSFSSLLLLLLLLLLRRPQVAANWDESEDFRAQALACLQQVRPYSRSSSAAVQQGG